MLVGITGKLVFIAIVGRFCSMRELGWDVASAVLFAGIWVTRCAQTGLILVVSALLRVTGVLDDGSIGLDGGEGVNDGRGKESGVS